MGGQDSRLSCQGTPARLAAARRFIGSASAIRDGEVLMLDLIYVACTVAFFALMLAFVRGLEIMGQDAGTSEREDR